MDGQSNTKDKMTKKEYNKMYYKTHREEHLQRFKVRVKCEKCNCEVNKQNLKLHQKSKRCKNNENDDPVINVDELVNQLIEIKKVLEKFNRP